jgi:uncharacterized protein YcaQ
LVLWSRLGHYQAEWLEQALEQKQVFEYWAHEACFVPIEDFGLYRHRMMDPGAMGWKYSERWMREQQELVARVLNHIRDNGPTRSSDFERLDGKAGGWWSWKPEKRSLEVLFTAGELMIAKRDKFQRIYDLRERILPGWDDADLPSMAEVERQFMLKAVKAMGLAKADWMGDYFRNAKTRPRPHPDTLVASDELRTIRVEGWDAPFYVHPDHWELANQAAAGKLKATHTTLLSPFDPVVWDRRRALELFDFDYRIECYTPAPKRKFGYFSLPLLRKGQLVGRVDAKAHRAQGVFELKALYLEAGIRASSAIARDLARAIRACARWHGCTQVHTAKTEPVQLASLLQHELAQP